MKKLAITLCVLGAFGIASGAFAAIQSEDISTVPHLKSEGFSTGMTQVTDTVRYLHSNKTIEPYYKKDPLANATDEKSKWYTVVKRWFDPAQDDELFGRHDITFTNSWFEMDSPFQAQKDENMAETARKKQTHAEIDDTVNMQDASPIKDVDSL